MARKAREVALSEEERADLKKRTPWSNRRTENGNSIKNYSSCFRWPWKQGNSKGIRRKQKKLYVGGETDILKKA